MRRQLYIRRIIGILVGLAIAVLLIDGAWGLAGRWFPSPVSPDSDDVTTLAGFVLAMPFAGKLLVVAGWLVAGFVAAFAALRIAQWRPAGWIVAALIVALDLWNATRLWRNRLGCWRSMRSRRWPARGPPSGTFTARGAATR